MKKLTQITVLTVLFITALSCNDSRRAKNFNQKTSLDDQGVKFAVGAHEAGLTEIKAAGIAQRKSTNPRVITFAKMMVNDHTTAGQKLDEIVKKNNVVVNDTLTTDHKKMLADMEQMSGENFDKAYMDMMVGDHGKVIDMFNIANNNKSAALQKFAKQTLPILSKHLDSAKAIQLSLK